MPWYSGIEEAMFVRPKSDRLTPATQTAIDGRLPLSVVGAS